MVLPSLRYSLERLMIDWLRTNSRWLLPSLLVTGFISALFVYTLHIQQKKQESYELVSGKVEVESPRKTANENSAQHEAQTPTTQEKKPVADGNIPRVKQQNEALDHSIKNVLSTPTVSRGKITIRPNNPTPEEIVQKLQLVPPKDLPAAEQKLLGLPVVWPVYYFSAKRLKDDKFTVMFDSSATGFGVVIAANMDLLTYTSIVSAKEEDMIRLSGIITRIDTNGTGQITLDTDSVSFIKTKQ